MVLHLEEGENADVWLWIVILKIFSFACFVHLLQWNILQIFLIYPPNKSFKDQNFSFYVVPHVDLCITHVFWFAQPVVSKILFFFP
jgi:hypothetical protein